jgi:hypothetical protein
MGFVFAHTRSDSESRRQLIDEISDRLWRECRIRASRTVLYECEKLYVVLDGDFHRFEKWMDDTRALLNRPAYWSDVQRDLLGGRSNPNVIGLEAAEERDLLEVELAIEALERLIRRALEGSEEARGVLVMLRETLDSVPRGRTATTPRSEEYLDFVRSHPCAVCRQPAEAHHAIGHRGIGLKPSDFASIPLCRRHHADIHRVGPRPFARKHDIDLIEVAFNLLHRYATGAWVTMHLGD